MQTDYYVATCDLRIPVADGTLCSTFDTESTFFYQATLRQLRRRIEKLIQQYFDSAFVFGPNEGLTVDSLQTLTKRLTGASYVLITVHGYQALWYQNKASNACQEESDNFSCIW
ncbi:MAG: hypothetical protein CMP20_15880 [Rickettsiales bacterium]|nr:hypothetical protein [Rickettsiales bacterium]